MGGLTPPNLMTQIHKKYPEQILLGTEASEGKYYHKIIFILSYFRHFKSYLAIHLSSTLFIIFKFGILK